VTGLGSLFPKTNSANDGFVIDRELLRRHVLAAAGASPAAAEELLAYNANPFDLARLDSLQLPLADEPQLDAWREYAADASARGVFAALADRLVQLRFPVEKDISQSETYRAASRRGLRPAGPPRLALEDPQTLALSLHFTTAGHVPVIVVPNRRDFVTLVQACSCRNEPEPIPDSMGACIVVGLNNWDRVARHRRRLEAERGGAMTEGEWATAFKALIPHKDLYQDRFIILSCAPYSAVPAAEIGLPDDQWRERSIALRLEHECTHYFTLRAFGVMRNNLLDEFVADFAGLAHAFGRYDAHLFLRFLGLEDYPSFRPGGRLGLYLGKPPLSPAAAAIIRHLVVRAALHVEAFTAKRDLHDAVERARIVVALAGLTLEELASDQADVLLASRLAGGSAAGAANKPIDGPS
jgi:hypothetical protein